MGVVLCCNKRQKQIKYELIQSEKNSISRTHYVIWTTKSLSSMIWQIPRKPWRMSKTDCNYKAKVSKFYSYFPLNSCESVLIAHVEWVVSDCSNLLSFKLRLVAVYWTKQEILNGFSKIYSRFPWNIPKTNRNLSQFKLFFTKFFFKTSSNPGS